MSKKNRCSCGHDTTNDRELYVRDITRGTQVMGIAISEFLEAYEHNPLAFTQRECMELYQEIMKVLPRYNLSYSVMLNERYLHMSDPSTCERFRAFTAEEFEARRDDFTIRIGEFVEPMHKLENDMEDVSSSISDNKFREMEARQHKMFNTFTMVLISILFRRV